MTRRMYRVTLSHDHGKIRIATVASSAEAAADMVCKAEHAPRSAVRDVAVIR